MRKLVLFFVFVCFLSVLISNVECTSPPNCANACKDPCADVDCKCGTYKDGCNCCDICKKCAGDKCVRLANEQCEDGYTCGKPDMSVQEIYTNPDITCIPEA
ncbi:hypothetical protein AVEN_57794-1 [Araneus ventricosus]|uniref:TNFR-Cys domain-containing protein n=1 Tax=Araneus ventricosus TaxID=182803 RepID=A0A4Y2LMK1_ARAVE|nr:hypothetical protein AVEN_57794-1 [Araneus ventricosus]